MAKMGKGKGSAKLGSLQTPYKGGACKMGK